MVSHASISNLEKNYDNARDNVDLIGLKNIEFGKLGG